MAKKATSPKVATIASKYFETEEQVRQVNQ